MTSDSAAGQVAFGGFVQIPMGERGGAHGTASGLGSKQAAYAPRGFRHGSRWKSSTSITSVPSNATPSPTWEPWNFITVKENVVFPDPPGTGKAHLSIGLSIRACQAGHRVGFAAAAEWVARLARHLTGSPAMVQSWDLNSSTILVSDAGSSSIGRWPVSISR